MNAVKIIILAFILLSAGIISTNIVLADDLGDGNTPPTQLANPLGTTDIPALAGTIINTVLGVVGSLALLMIIYGGFTWMTAAGNQEAVKKGRDILIWAFIGIVIIFSAYALVKFAFTTIGVV